MASWVTPPLWVPGVTPGNASNLQKLSDDLTTIGQTPPAWTPTVLAGWSSNFTVSGWKRELDKQVDFWIKVLFTGLPAGSGVVTLSLPSTPSVSIPSWASLGTFSIRDTSGGASTTGTCNYAGGSNVAAFFGGSTRLTNANAYTLASGDSAWFEGRYWVD